MTSVMGTIPNRRDSDVEHPPHYGGDSAYEVIKVIEAWGLGFNLGNAIKYIGRAGKKEATPTVKDLRKAVWYIIREIQGLDGRLPHEEIEELLESGALPALKD